jgi:xylulokinase
MEGVAYELRACLDVLSKMSLEPAHIVSMGGGSRGDVWNQIRANVTGRPVYVPRVSDAASFGAMMLACKGAGIIGDLTEASTTLNPPQRVYHPDPAAKAVYDQLYPIYNDFYSSVESLFERLEAVEMG